MVALSGLLSQGFLDKKDPGNVVMEALMKNDVMAVLCCPLAQVRYHACTLALWLTTCPGGGMTAAIECNCLHDLIYTKMMITCTEVIRHHSRLRHALFSPRLTLASPTHALGPRSWDPIHCLVMPGEALSGRPATVTGEDQRDLRYGSKRSQPGSAP